MCEYIIYFKQDGVKEFAKMYVFISVNVFIRMSVIFAIKRRKYLIFNLFTKLSRKRRTKLNALVIPILSKRFLV